MSRIPLTSHVNPSNTFAVPDLSYDDANLLKTLNLRRGDGAGLCLFSAVFLPFIDFLQLRILGLHLSLSSSSLGKQDIKRRTVLSSLD